MKKLAMLLAVVAITFASGTAKADGNDDSAQSGSSSPYHWGLAFTIGEGFYVIDNEVWRGPVSFEVVPSWGWDWFKFDLGLAVTFESLEIADTDVGHWSFSFRPGFRIGFKFFRPVFGGVSSRADSLTGPMKRRSPGGDIP
ncbi:MAG TPA: hypothetical protein PLZ31_11410, partial [Myxococcota bacterium]|nr:hypothetical protein [Myxococcota bacterium]